jgi:hypothetical protein
VIACGHGGTPACSPLIACGHGGTPACSPLIACGHGGTPACSPLIVCGHGGTPACSPVDGTVWQHAPFVNCRHQLQTCRAWCSLIFFTIVL